MKPAVVVDVGNTRIKWGRCANDHVAEMASLPHDDVRTWRGQLALWNLSIWNLSPDNSWAISGVHPGQVDIFCKWLESQQTSISVINSHRQLPLTIDVHYPEKVGLDRLLNAVAAN